MTPLDLPGAQQAEICIPLELAPPPLFGALLNPPATAELAQTRPSLLQTCRRSAAAGQVRLKPRPVPLPPRLLFFSRVIAHELVSTKGWLSTGLGLTMIVRLTLLVQFPQGILFLKPTSSIYCVRATCALSQGASGGLRQI